MRTTTRLALATAGAATLMTGFGVAGAQAADGQVSGQLKPVVLNGSHGSGQAWIKVHGNTVTVTAEATGLLAGSPHAAHIHFGADAAHTCPVAGDDKDDSGTITTSEGVPSYGNVQVSLTTKGDTSPDSALAVDRFDTAQGGSISYERGSIQVSDEVAHAITDGQTAIVVHGIDYNGDGTYDGDAKSDLNPDLPAEATDPALCGVLSAMPAGGMDTGGGGTATAATTINAAPTGVGTGTLAAAGLAVVGLGAGALTVRRARSRA